MNNATTTGRPRRAAPRRGKRVLCVCLFIYLFNHYRGICMRISFPEDKRW